MVNLRTWLTANQQSINGYVISVRGSVAVHRLANLVTLCDGHGVFFVAASGQIRMAPTVHRCGHRAVVYFGPYPRSGSPEA